MTYVVQNAALAGAEPIASTSTVQRHALGTLVTAIDPVYGVGEFIYLKGATSTAVGSWVSFLEDDWTTVLLAANAVGRVAVAMSANVADQYGWYQIKGKAVGAALTGFLDDADVYATSTAGSVDDAVVVGDLVQGARGASAVSGGLADFEIDRPYVNNGEFFDSTALTATTAELNKLTGVTATTAELNTLAGITATTAELNEYVVNLDIADGSADTVYYAVCPHAGTINKIWTVIDGAVLTADITVTAAIGATPITNGVVTIATAASAAGDIDSATPTAANVVTAGQAVNFTVAGGGAGGTPRVHLAMVVSR